MYSDDVGVAEKPDNFKPSAHCQIIQGIISILPRWQPSGDEAENRFCRFLFFGEPRPRCRKWKVRVLCGARGGCSKPVVTYTVIFKASVNVVAKSNPRFPPPLRGAESDSRTERGGAG